MKLRVLVVSSVLAIAAACGGDDPKIQGNNGDNNGANNGATNNGATNNGATNNGVVNNGATNNGATNNGATNNGATNNGSTNNNTTATNNTTGTNNQNPIACAGDFGAADACGGDLVGTWNVNGACTNYDYEATIRSYCSDAVVNDIVVTSSGTLVVDASTYTQNVTGQVDVDLSTPSGCGLGNCSFVQSGLSVVGQATCTAGANGGCDCTAVITFEQNATGTYQTDGNGVATIDSGETYYYCVEQGTLTQRRFGTQADEAEPTVTYTAQ